MNPFLSLPVIFQNLSSTLNVLTAMLTLALLVSACGSFIISTSSRPGRVVDQVREGDPALLAERRAMILKHLELQSANGTRSNTGCFRSSA